MEWITETALAKHLRQQGMIDAIDLAFADFLIRLSGEKGRPEHHLAFLLLSHTVLSGKHVCLDVESVSEKRVAEVFPDTPFLNTAPLSSLTTPLFSSWIESLRSSPVVGVSGEYKPVILSEKNQLYLYRFHEYEKSIAASIMKRVSQYCLQDRLVNRTPRLNSFFPNPKTVPDWQRVAAYSAITHPFTVISGGPGTGKTHTVAAIMGMLLDGNPHLKISLCAPTGKAAARLQESIRAVKTRMAESAPLYEKIPETASTIHRLIGIQKQPPYFTHHQGHPLPTDILIVDEASMVSLSLLARVFDALPDHARVILIGDKNQLASVEAGAVFGDICSLSKTTLFSQKFADRYHEETGERLSLPEPPSAPSPLDDCVVELTYSYRFEKRPEIGALSRCVLEGDKKGVFDLLQNKEAAAVVYRELSSFTRPEEGIRPMMATYFHQIISAPSVAEAFVRLERFRILCSRRNGEWGVLGVNQTVEALLAKNHSIDPANRFYKGRPILILQNDYGLGLYNGDVGLVWEDETGVEKVFFPSPDNQFRAVVPARLPDHETVFAMTIHKSQGSEFDSVLMILPKGAERLLSRELVYTGMTRARDKIEVWADRDALERAILTPVERWSGLAAYFSSGLGQ
jgi:exodeoxyribonuclease V alpha subunit